MTEKARNFTETPDNKYAGVIPSDQLIADFLRQQLVMSSQQENTWMVEISAQFYLFLFGLLATLNIGVMLWILITRPYV